MSDAAASLPRLTPKQQRFVDFYLGECRFNASAAALKAGYSHRSEGPRLLSNAVIRARIDAALRVSATTSEETLALLGEDARLDTVDIIALAAREGSPAIAAAVVSSLVSARTSARQGLAKAHGLFSQNLHVTGDLVTRVYVGISPEDFDAEDGDREGVG